MAVQHKMTAAEFLQLPETNEHIELIDGEIIVAPAPETGHQFTNARAYDLVKALALGGFVLFSPIDVLLGDHDIVEPDLLWISPESNCRIERKYIAGAPDLVLEILSPSTALYDKRTKFQLYEQHGVREYWIIDPEARYIEVWRLVEAKFAQLGIFGVGETFTAAVLGDKTVEVSALFGAA